jgi:hypothetical protein
MSTSLQRRLATLARRVAPADGGYARLVRQWAEDRDRDRRAHLARVPADLRDAVAALLGGPDEADELSSWVIWPFARWAVMPAGFVFPRALVEWILHPPRGWYMGRTCGRCGLNVPLLSTWSNDPDPPGTIVVFPTCPACGGRTSYGAGSAPQEDA